jgi:hypothetical protein
LIGDPQNLLVMPGDEERAGPVDVGGRGAEGRDEKRGEKPAGRPASEKMPLKEGHGSIYAMRGRKASPLVVMKRGGQRIKTAVR